MMKSNYIIDLINSQKEATTIKSISEINITSDGIYNCCIEEEKTNIKISSQTKAILKINTNKENIEVNITLESNSVLGYYFIGNAKKTNINMTVNEDSYAEIYNMNVEGDSDTLLNIDLNGYRAETEVNMGLYLNKKDNHYYKIKISHLFGNTSSNVMVKAILNDESTCNFDIESYIKKGSHGANAYQKSKVINLSETTKSNINPILKIDDYDVIGGHGATVSTISENDLYYLESRGINKNDALSLITLGNILDNTPDYIKSDIEQIVERRMKNE